MHIHSRIAEFGGFSTFLCDNHPGLESSVADDRHSRLLRPQTSEADTCIFTDRYMGS
jgi:hypothetical protein